MKVRVRIISEVSDLKRKKIAYGIFIEERKMDRERICYYLMDLRSRKNGVFSVFYDQDCGFLL